MSNLGDEGDGDGPRLLSVGNAGAKHVRSGVPPASRFAGDLPTQFFAWKSDVGLIRGSVRALPDHVWAGLKGWVNWQNKEMANRGSWGGGSTASHSSQAVFL